MDKKDQRLLTELILNSRAPLNQIAKKVSVSREVASYRLNKLIKDKIILKLYAIINTEALGFSRYTCFFQLKKITHGKETEFLKYLINHDFVTYIGPVIGKWNVVFDLLTKDRKHLEFVVKEIANSISRYIESYIIVNTGAEQEIFPAKTFGIQKEISYKHISGKVKLDKTDLGILELLSRDSRIGYKEISKTFKLTGNAIKYRIKNLEKQGVIQGYTASIDLRKLGYEWYNIQVKFTENKKELQLKQFLRQDPRVTYFYKYLGHENWDLDIGVTVKDSLELRGFILDLRKSFGDVLKIYDLYVIVEESKPNQAPKGVFQSINQ